MTRPALVINPVAGKGTDPLEIVRAVRAACGGDPEIRVTSSAGDARRFGAAAANAGAHEIWVAGGDGTLHEVVSGLRDAGAEMGPVLVPLPLGTGNDLVRSLGIPLNWRKAVECLSSSSGVVELDLMSVRLDGAERLGLNAVIAGNGGRVGEVLDQDGKSRWGALAYLRSAAEIALELEPLELTLAVDRDAAEVRRVLNVVVANGRYAGHGILIAPGARPDDRKLEMVVVDEGALPEILRMLPSLLAGEEPPHDAWSQRSITSLRLKGPESRPVPVSVDGENLAAHEITVALAPDRVRVRAPSDHPEVTDAR